MKLRFNLSLLLILCSLIPSFAQKNQPLSDPRGLTIYQIMVAAFQHGEPGAPGYTAMWGPDNARKDGNLRGIINSVEYLDSLGVNAVWLTPIFDCSEMYMGHPLLDSPKLAATGYFTNDYFKIDPHWGTEAELRELVDKLHSRGIMLILDGVFGHHGGVKTPSPKGNTIDNTPSKDGRGYEAPLSYPGSLEYYKEVATYWIENFDIDGWRLDQAYQAVQNGHNYWNEIRAAVEETCAARKARGEQWGTLGYMVGEDWGSPEVINNGVYKDGGLISAFDFDGNGRITKLEDPFYDILFVYSAPTVRGYLNDDVMPNLFLSNHDVRRVGDFVERDENYFDALKMRHAILAAYPGPITMYYGDEFGDDTRNAVGAQPDNIARTSGHITANSPEEADLHDYVAKVMNLRKDHPAMWRGTRSFAKANENLLLVTASDNESGEKIMIAFPTADCTYEAPEGAVNLFDGKEAGTMNLKALVPQFILL